MFLGNMSSASEHDAVPFVAFHFPFAEPDGFVFQRLVRIFVQEQVFWQPTLCSARLVSKAWRRGISQAVEVLAPRPSVSTTQLAQLPHIFPNLKVLRVQSPVTEAGEPGRVNDEGQGQDRALQALGNSGSGLSSSLSALHLLNVDVGPRGALALRNLHSLSLVEVQGSAKTCMAVLRALPGCPALRHLRVRPNTLLGPLSIFADDDGREYQYCSNLLHRAAQLTGLRSLACSAAGASSGSITQLTALRQLTSLELQDLPLASVAGLAEVAPALRQLAFSFEYSTMLPGEEQEGSWVMPDISSLLPLACLAGLQSLSAPFELFPSPNALSQLAGLTRLSVNFHAARLGVLEEGESMSCDAACVALLRRLPNLRSLCLSGAEMELSHHSLAYLSLLAPTLTSLVIQQCHKVENEVMGAIGHLQHLRRLRLSSTSFDGEGLEALRRLQVLTWLVLDNCAGVMNTWELAEAVAQVSSLRFLRLSSHPYMGRSTLDRILTSHPALELLQTTWRPKAPRDQPTAPQGQQPQVSMQLQQLQLRQQGQQEGQGQPLLRQQQQQQRDGEGEGGGPSSEVEEDDFTWCQRWQFVLQHSLDPRELYVPGQWFSEFDARQALEKLGAGA